MSLLKPPSIKITWGNTGLTTQFGSYRVWRRISRGVAGPWYVVSTHSVPAGYSQTNVEGYHTQFIDYEAGWAIANGQWYDGWQYGVTVVNSVTGIESLLTVYSSNVQATADSLAWLVCNNAPYLNQPIPYLGVADVADADSFQDFQVAGRDLSVVRTRSELAAKRYNLQWRETGTPVTEDLVRLRRAAANSGRMVCLHLPTGDRMMGALASPKIKHAARDLKFMDVTADFVETTRQPEGDNVQCNLPASTVLNGTNMHVSSLSSTYLNPGSSGFSFILAGGFGSSGASRYFLSKGNGGTADGYFFRSTAVAGTIEMFIDGATTTATTTAASQTALYDGEVHVLVGTTTGTAQALYRDGALTPIATSSATHGAVTNALGLCVGANNVTDSTSAGASLAAMTGAQSWGVWPSRVLTAAEAQAAAYYLLGYPGYRMPGGLGAFYDLRDNRCWPGYGTTLTDLAGNNNTATMRGTPPTRGIPWDMTKVDAF